MISIKYLGALLLLALLAAPGFGARADNPTSIEVPVRRVLFPPREYHDGDLVQVVIEGELPDPCYLLGKATIIRDASGAVVIHQSAWRHSSEACDTGDLLGESPYSTEISLGTFRPGDYRIAFNPDDGSVGYRQLHVDTGRVSAVDDLNYAHITSLNAHDVVIEGMPVIVTLIGVFSSSCGKLQDPVGVENQGDTVVIRPVEISLGNCANSSPAFEKTLELGVLPPGEYLLHVRSGGGRAVQKTFKVLRTHPQAALGSRR